MISECPAGSILPLLGFDSGSNRTRRNDRRLVSTPHMTSKASSQKSSALIAFARDRLHVRISPMRVGATVFVLQEVAGMLERSGRISRTACLWLVLLLISACRPCAGAVQPPTVAVDDQGVYARSAAGGEGMVRYVFDWGDGTEGVGSPVKIGVPGRARHTWLKPGQYTVRARAIRIPDGASGWSDSCAFPVKTSAAWGQPLRPRGFSASSDAPGSSPGKLLKGQGWSSAAQPNPDRREWVLVDLGAPRTVTQIALKPMRGGEGFPAAFTVEYCTDNGHNWTPIPIYTFQEFPNPGDETVLLETGLLCARQVRITATRLSPVAGGFAFRLRGIVFREARDAPFFTSLGGSFDADLNNMWNIFGLASNEITPNGDGWWDGPGGVLACASTEWHEWDVLKLCWADLPRDTARLRGAIVNMPMDADGYVWASDGGPLHLGLQKHFDYNAIDIIASLKYFLWTGEQGFFTQALPAETQKRCGVTTLLDKLRKEMRYQLKVLDGRNGLLKIPDPDYDGTPGSKGTTYWDAHPTGYLSAYPNALFYASVAAMARIEGLAGDPGRRTYYVNLMPLIRKRFDETFWSPEKGRYLSTVDRTGVKHDYGITATNLYAIVYGVAEKARAAAVMKWLSGKRIVDGDTSQGADIYHWKIAPRANTVAFESVTPHWWAGGFAGVNLDPGGWGRWGQNIQNGGAIFYTSYYDVLARLKVNGPDDAFNRFSTIVKAFHRDSLRPDTPGHYGPAGTPAFGVGVWVSFPESGLVPLAMFYGFLGIEPAVDGLRVHPALPAQMKYAGVRDLLFHGAHFRITASRSAHRMTLRRVGANRFEATVPVGVTSLIPHPRSP